MASYSSKPNLVLLQLIPKLTKEAGGYITDFEGGDKYVKNKTILATNAKINKEMIEVLK